MTDDVESVRIAARNVINEFAQDGVKYLELRSTPRKNEATGKKKKIIQTISKHCLLTLNMFARYDKTCIPGYRSFCH